MLVAPPRCGERLRLLLAREGLLARGPRPRAPARTRVAAFPLEPGAEGRARSLAPEACPEAELVEAACAVKRRPPPPGLGYVIIGDVAVVSLDERVRGREREAAERILAAHPGLRAVYGKDATVGEHRVQRLVLLAGEPVEETIYTEHGLRFPVRLGRVYVNPRLATEHARIASLIRPGETVLDMFAGIGGFTLHAAATGKPRITVANDVNPDAYEALLGALRLNRSRLRSPVLALNMDARGLPGILRPVFDRVIMNLPHTAHMFLPVARRLCSPRGCVIHLYTVASSPGEALARLPGWAKAVSAVRVLDYAPRRFIYRVDIHAAGLEGDH